MKYNAPFGSTDPNAAYVDRNTPGATSGSRVPAAALEHPQREIAAVIAAAGIDPSAEDLTQLLQAIQFIVNAATGGAGDPNYVLMTQARLRLPIFPEVTTSDGKLALSSPSAGTVRLLPGYTFLHRGIFLVTTVQTDFVTAAGKIYHLRWNPTTGYALKDLADTAYNPGGALAETNIAFDSSYDDMLIARVVTNASNVATITPLVNKNSLSASGELYFLASLAFQDDFAPSAITNYVKVDINWARTPMTCIQAVTDGPPDAEWNFGTKPLSRYQLAVYSQASRNNAEWVAWQAWR